MSRLLILAGVLAFVFPTSALAQDNERLPSLSPGVFEVRGPVRVSLPQIERQPLSGFGPALPVFTVGPRPPVERPFQPDLDALPDLSLPEPPEPPVSLVEVTENRLEGGAGTRLARYGRADLSFAGEGGRFFLDADYDGLSVSDEATIAEDLVDFDRAQVRAGGQSFAPGRLRLEGQALVESYALPGIGTPEDRRGRRHLGVEGGTSGVGAIPFDVTVGYANARLGRTGGESDETTENRVDARAEAALLRRRLRFDAAAGTSGLEGGVGTDVQYATGGGALAFERPSGLVLSVGARALGYRSSDRVGDGNAGVVGPIVDVQLPLGPALLVFGQNDPHLKTRSVFSLSQENPYVGGPLALVPDVVPLDAQGGVEARVGPLRVRGYALATFAPTYLIFERGPTGLYDQEIVRARTAGLGGDAAVRLASGLSASAGFEIRSGSIDGAEIPFLAPLTGHASLGVPFSWGRIGLAAYGESSRPVDRSGQGEAPAWGRLELDARYDVTPLISAVVRGQRLVGTQERWPGFREPGFAIEAGVRLAW